jgi:hypothetical protein
VISNHYEEICHGRVEALVPSILHVNEVMLEKKMCRNLHEQTGAVLTQ